VQRLTEVLKSNGATIEEWRVLSLLDGDVGHTMTEIAEFADGAGPNSHQGRRPDGVGQSRPAPGRRCDRRRVLVFASDRGRQAVRQGNRLVKREHDDLVSAVGPEEINLLNALLVRCPGVSADASPRWLARSPPPLGGRHLDEHLGEALAAQVGHLGVARRVPDREENVGPFAAWARPQISVEETHRVRRVGERAQAHPVQAGNEERPQAMPTLSSRSSSSAAGPSGIVVYFSAKHTTSQGTTSR